MDRYGGLKFRCIFNWDYAQQRSIDVLHNLTRDIHETHLKFNSHEELKGMTMLTAYQWTVDNELSFFYRLDMRSIVLSPDECNVVGGAASVRGKVKSKQLNDVESGQQVRFVELGILFKHLLQCTRINKIN